MWNNGAVEVSEHVDNSCVYQDSRRGDGGGGGGGGIVFALGWGRLLLLVLMLFLSSLLLFRLRLLCWALGRRSSRCVWGRGRSLAFAGSVSLEDGAHPLDILAQATTLDILALGGRSGIGGRRHVCCGSERELNAATAEKTTATATVTMTTTTKHWQTGDHVPRIYEAKVVARRRRSDVHAGQLRNPWSLATGSTGPICSGHRKPGRGPHSSHSQYTSRGTASTLRATERGGDGQRWRAAMTLAGSKHSGREACLYVWARRRVGGNRGLPSGPACWDGPHSRTTRKRRDDRESGPLVAKCGKSQGTAWSECVPTCIGRLRPKPSVLFGRHQRQIRPSAVSADIHPYAAHCLSYYVHTLVGCTYSTTYIHLLPPCFIQQIAATSHSTHGYCQSALHVACVAHAPAKLLAYPLPPPTWLPSVPACCAGTRDILTPCHRG